MKIVKICTGIIINVCIASAYALEESFYVYLFKMFVST